MSALRWAGSATLLGQIITWAITILVIRLLTPEDYGLMAIAMLFISFLVLVNELGMGAVVVQREDLDQETIRKIFGLILLINTMFFIALFGASPHIARFFEEERLVPIIRVLALQFPIAAFEIIPVSLLERNLDFKKKSLTLLVANTSGALVTLILALHDYEVWALVWGGLTAAVLRSLLFNIFASYLVWPKFSLRNMREVVSFGGLVSMERGMWFFYTQADLFVIGKVLGKELLGIYSVAMHLASLIMHKTGGILYEVAFPSFSKVQSDREKVGTYFLKAVRIISFIVFPIFFGMSSVAPELVNVLLGKKWQSVGLVLSILSLVMPLRMISNLFPPALQGVGRADISVFNLLLAMIVMPTAFLFATEWGIIGVSIAWVSAFPIVFVVMILNARKVLGIDVYELFKAMAIPASLSTVMYVVVIGAKYIIGDDLLPLGRLVIMVSVGILTYVGLMLILQRQTWSELFALVKR